MENMPLLRFSLMKAQDVLDGMSKHKAGLSQEKNLLCILAKHVTGLYTVFLHLGQKKGI